MIGLPDLPVRQLSAQDGQMCVVLVGGNEVYCSWILVYGGSDGSLLPSELVPVPMP